MIIKWPSQLLAKALLKRAATSSVAAVHAASIIQYKHAAYVVKVLEAAPSLRAFVRDTAITNVTATGSEGQKQLVCILTLFETLSAEKKKAFILAYKHLATLAGHGPMYLAHQTVYQGNHLPPHYEP